MYCHSDILEFLTLEFVTYQNSYVLEYLLYLDFQCIGIIIISNVSEILELTVIYIGIYNALEFLVYWN